MTELKQDLRFRFAGLACRLICGGVLVYSALIKIWGPSESYAEVLSSFFPAGTTAGFLSVCGAAAWTMLYCGGFLAAGIFTRQSAALAAFFSAAGFFGAVFAKGVSETACLLAAPGTIWAVLLQLVMLALACGAWLWGRFSFTIDECARKN